MTKVFINDGASNYNMDGINRANAKKIKTGFKDTPFYLVVLGKDYASHELS